MKPLIVRLQQSPRASIAFTIDGNACSGFDGDTVMTAVLTTASQLREHEVGGLPRAGFCAMAACQDCWIDTESGERFRACSTPLVEGMALITRRVA